jgi:hypothetical protein
MPNTVYTYTPTSWVAGVTPASQPNMNNLETQSKVALHAFNPDVVGAGLVLSGCAVSGTVGTTTVNIGSGQAYTVMSDGTTGAITVVSATQTTVTPNATYNLYLQPDGTYYWSTSNSPAANSLSLATVATNGSGQIATITDKRPTLITFLPTAIGALQMTPLLTLTLGTPITAPVVTGTVASAVAGAGMGTGVYKYVVTFAFDGGETTQSATITVTTTGGNNQVSLTGIPTSPDPRITRRKLYRTAVGGSSYTWVKTIGDNTTTTYTDAATDAAIAGSKTFPARSTAGGTLRSGYPWSGVAASITNVGFCTGVTFAQTGMVTGDSSTAALFNGTTDKITFPTSGLPSGNQPWTILAIAKPTNATNASPATVAFFGNGAANGQAASIYQAAAGGWVASTISGDTAATGTSAAAAKHLLAGTWDGTTLTMNVDGGAATNTATPGVRSLTPTAGRIACSNNGADVNFFPGTVQKVAIFNYALSAQQIAFYNTLMGGASGNVTFDQQIFDDGAVRYYTLGDAVSSTTAAETSRYDTVMAPDGTITANNLAVKGVGGTQAAGLGVPVIVAQVSATLITDNSLHTILSYYPPASGLYRVSGYIEMRGSTAATLLAQVDYNDDIGTPVINLATSNTATGAPQNIGAVSRSPATGVPIYPISFYALNTRVINCYYQRPAGTANDLVWYTIERLA